MALAILDPLAFEKGIVRFSVDTGTNRYYRLKIGRSIEPRSGIDWVNDVYYTTPLAVNDAGGELLSTAKEISVPRARFDGGVAFVQLLSFKTPEGKSPAFSRVVKIP